jgi:hypothetical protein
MRRQLARDPEATRGGNPTNPTRAKSSPCEMKRGGSQGPPAVATMAWRHSTPGHLPHVIASKTVAGLEPIGGLLKPARTAVREEAPSESMVDRTRGKHRPRLITTHDEANLAGSHQLG